MGPEIAYTFALAGPPNVGKSTVFNGLTGLDQHVGNWPGKTVAKMTGHFLREGKRVEVVDLPGTYALSSSSEEERITRDYLLLDPPDVVMALVNAASLERDLYLISELMTLPVPLVVGINMLDVAEAEGLKVEPKVLEAALGVPVVELVARERRGLQELMEAACDLAEGRTPDLEPNRPVVRENHRPVLEQLETRLAGRSVGGYPADWVALKLLEGDTDITEIVEESLGDDWGEINALLAEHDDAYVDIAGGRYDWIARMLRAALVRPPRGVTGITDRLDRVATHPFWGLVVLLGVLAALFALTYSVAGPAASALSDLITGDLAQAVRGWLSGAPDWVSGLLADGVLGGAGTVISFVPILVVFFAALALLEDVGYMARAAYVMDRYMHWMGLHGKSCLPLLLGFGCNVPAVLGTRIIEERRTRLLTMLLTPFVPCTGRLAVLVFLAPAFFGSMAPWALVALVGGNLVVLGLVGVGVNRLVFKGERSAFIMEMPLYHTPSVRTIGLYVWRNTLAFLKKAGTIIVLAAALVWALSNFPGSEPAHSVLGSAGRFLEPVGAVMGMGDWRLLVALGSSVVAKENSVATLGVLFGMAGTGGDLAARVAAVMTPAAAAAFLVFQMTFIPCAATVAAIRQESRSWRFTGMSLGLMFVLAFLLSVLVYQVGSLF